MNRSDALAALSVTRRLAAAAVALGAILALGRVPAAHAEGVADEAELHFQIGQENAAKGDLRGALEHFLLSNRLVPNRNVVYNIARVFEQMRRYADAHRHYVDALTGETKPQAIQDVKAALVRIAPHVAVLDITTTPPGATIYIDRKDLGSRGRAPRPLALPPGRYRVIAEMDGYEPKTSGDVDAAVGKSTPVTLALTRIVGGVRVEPADPGARGAVVRADDERGPPGCTIPCELSLPPGPHQLFFTREGFMSPSHPVTVAAGRTVVVLASLRPVTGSLVVNTDEQGARVTVGNKTLGFTPVVIPDGPVGVQKIRVSRHGYVPIEREVSIKQGEQAQMSDLVLVPIREVTAVSRYAETLDNAPSSVSIIDGRELRAFGYPTIAEAIRGTRGVYLQNDRVYSSAGIRGVGQPNDYGNRLLVLSDGQSLNDNLLNSSYIGSDGRVGLHDIDRIEVVRGPGSLLYGTGAFAGVVNLVTRPRDEPNQVNVGVGTYDNSVFHTNAGFHYNFRPNIGVWASASLARSEGVDVDLTLKDPPGKRVTAHGADRFVSGGTAGRAWVGPFTVQWLYQKREQKTPIGSYGTRFDDTRNQSTDTRMMVEARFEPQLSQSFQLMTRAHANHYGFEGVYVFEDPTSADITKNTENFAGTWVGGEARLVFNPSPKLRITGGGEGQFHLQAEMTGKEAQAGKPYLNVNAPYNFGAGYALIEGQPVSWFRASGGVRVDVYSTFGPIVVPRAALIFHPSEGGTLKLMGGRAFRAPSIYELNYNDGGETQVRAKALRPESIYSGEIEYSHRFLKDWIALAAVHGSYLQNLISTQPVSAKSTLVSYQNSDVPALSLGGDVEIRREWRYGWMLSATYGYQYARYLDDKNKNPRVVAAPEHLASFRGVAPVVPEYASAALRVTLEAPRRIDSTSNDLTPAAAILDATVSGDVNRFGLHYVVGVYNLANWKYALPVTQNFLGRTMPQNGRTFLLSVAGVYP